MWDMSYVNNVDSITTYLLATNASLMSTDSNESKHSVHKPVTELLYLYLVFNYIGDADLKATYALDWIVMQPFLLCNAIRDITLFFLFHFNKHCEMSRQLCVHVAMYAVLGTNLKAR